MASVSAQEIYKRYLSSLPASERLRLLAMLAQGLASEASVGEQTKRSIMELHGPGKEIWEGMDPQSYVDQLRDEWEVLLLPIDTTLPPIAPDNLPERNACQQSPHP